MDAVFSTFAGSPTNDAIQAIEREMAPRLSAHQNAIYLNARFVRPHRCGLAEARGTWGWTRNP